AACTNRREPRSSRRCVVLRVERSLAPSETARVAVTRLVPLAEAGPIVVLIRVLRSVAAVVPVVAVLVVAVANGIVAVAIAAVVASFVKAVTVAACERRVLISARASRSATVNVVAPALIDPIVALITAIPVDVVEALAITGCEAAAEFVSIRVATAVATVIAVIGIAVPAFTFRLESPAVSGVIRALSNAVPISTLERRVVLRCCRCRQQCAGDRRKEPLSPASTHCRCLPGWHTCLGCKRHAT